MLDNNINLKIKVLKYIISYYHEKNQEQFYKISFYNLKIKHFMACFVLFRLHFRIEQGKFLAQTIFSTSFLLQSWLIKCPNHSNYSIQNHKMGQAWSKLLSNSYVGGLLNILFIPQVVGTRFQVPCTKYVLLHKRSSWYGKTMYYLCSATPLIM